MTSREVAIVFSNIEALYPIHVEILAALERLCEDPEHADSVGEIFMQIVCFFLFYLRKRMTKTK